MVEAMAQVGGIVMLDPKDEASRLMGQASPSLAA